MGATVVSFISEKGGVGKTTCCYHIAVGLKRFHKKRVLVLDTDYQRGGITCRFIPAMLEDFKRGEVPKSTLYSVFRSIYTELKEIPALDIVTGKYEMTLVPSDPRLTEVTMDKVPGRHNISVIHKKTYSHLSAIARAIEPLKNDFDYILIDTHPEISDLLSSVIFASDYCVSPVKLDQQSSVGVPTAIEAIKQVNEDCEMLARIDNVFSYTPTKFAGSIAMMAREYGGKLIYSMQNQYSRLKASNSIFTNYVTEGDGIRTAAASYNAVYDMDGQIAENQAEQFKAITKEFIVRCK